MVTDPYNDDDDDHPTLQRPAPPSGMAAKLGSGFRAVAVSPPPSQQTQLSPQQPPLALEEFLDSGFPEEEDTAVDREPLQPLEDVTEAEPPRRIMTTMPLDAERTVTVPVDVEALLRRASRRDDGK